MPKRELSYPKQIADWLEDWGEKLTQPGEMTLIGSGGLLWHVHQAGRNDPLPENSMDVLQKKLRYLPMTRLLAVNSKNHTDGM